MFLFDFFLIVFLVFAGVFMFIGVKFLGFFLVLELFLALSNDESVVISCLCFGFVGYAWVGIPLLSNVSPGIR